MIMEDGRLDLLSYRCEWSSSNVSVEALQSASSYSWSTRANILTPSSLLTLYLAITKICICTDHLDHYMNRLETRTCCGQEKKISTKEALFRFRSLLNELYIVVNRVIFICSRPMRICNCTFILVSCIPACCLLRFVSNKLSPRPQPHN